MRTSNLCSLTCSVLRSRWQDNIVTRWYLPPEKSRQETGNKTGVGALHWIWQPSPSQRRYPMVGSPSAPLPADTLESVGPWGSSDGPSPPKGDTLCQATDTMALQFLQQGAHHLLGQPCEGALITAKFFLLSYQTLPPCDVHPGVP